jgi:Cu/Ag efflux protein CusF
MIRMPKWVVAVLALGVMAAVSVPARAEEKVFRDKVKSVNADKKTFTMTDEQGKEFTYKLDDNSIINDGTDKGGLANLKAGDEVTVLYEIGVLANTARYVLVHNDKNKDRELARGAVKTWDADKKEMTITELNQKDRTFNVGGDAKVELSGKPAKLNDLKLGDRVTMIYDSKGGKNTVLDIVADRK